MKRLLKRVLQTSLIATCLLAIETGLTLPSAQALWQLAETIGDKGQLLGHQRDIFDLAVSPDGAYLASASFDGTTRIWRTSDWSLMHALPGHANWVGSVDFSPTQPILATGGLEGQVQIWDLASGNLLHSLTEANKGILALNFSRDGQYLATAGLDHKIRIYQTASADQPWKLLHTLEHHPGGVTSLSFSPDGKYLASAGFNDLAIRIWEPQTGKLLHLLSEHREEVNVVRFSPDGKYLASGGADKRIILWDTQTLRPITRLAGHLKPVWSLAFHPLLPLLASGSVGDHSIRLWSLPQGVNIQTLTKTSENTYGLAFLPQGQTLVSAHNDAKLRVWQDLEGLTNSADAVRLKLGLSWELSPEQQPNSLGLAIFLTNQGAQNFENVEAEVRVLSPGVKLQLPVQRFLLKQLEMERRKSLSLRFDLPADFKQSKLELQLVITTAGAEPLILPIQIPYTPRASQ